MLEYRIIHRDNGDTITDVSIIEQEVRTLVDQDTGEEVQHRGQKVRRAFAPNDFLPADVTTETASEAQMQAAESDMAKAAKEWVESRTGAVLVDIDTLSTVKAFKDVAEAAHEVVRQQANRIEELEAQNEVKNKAQLAPINKPHNP